MAVVKCGKGHFYDNEKFTQCPHCQNGEFQDDVTVAFTSRQTENFAVEYVQSKGKHQHLKLDQERTIGIYSERGENRYVAGWLVCMEGPSKGCDYRIYAGFNKIGRGYENDIVLKEDMQVSREVHCSLVYEEKRNVFYLVPKGGNLVYLNDEAIREAEEIKDGDMVRLGETSLEFAAFCKGDKKWK